MARAHARLGDPTTGVCHVCQNEPTRSGTITSASSYAKSDDIGMARNGDTVTASCGHTGIINSASSKTTIQDVGAARTDDTFTGDYEGHILSGSTNVTTE